MSVPLAVALLFCRMKLPVKDAVPEGTAVPLPSIKLMRPVALLLMIVRPPVPVMAPPRLEQVSCFHSV